MPLLTVEQVADRYALSPKTIYNQRARGESPGALGFKVGSVIRWDTDDLEAYEQAAKAERVAS